MKAVLDTNVLISAAIQPRGDSRVTFDAWSRGEFTLVTSPQLIAELERALGYPRVQRRLHWTDEQRTLFTVHLRIGSQIVVPAALEDTVVESDPDDDILFATAIAGAVDHIVTGDRQVLAVGSYAGIQIVTPREFAATLRRRRTPRP